MKKILFAAAALISIAGQVLAEELPTCFVAPFTGDTTAIQMWQPAMGEGLGEMLTTELGKINKFQMLEVSQIAELKNEIAMGSDGWVDPAQKTDKGGFSAADFMFTAKVSRFGNKEARIGLGGFVPGNFGNLGVRTTTADVRIDWRLVDVATRKIIKTGSSTAQQKGGGFDVGTTIGGHGGNIGFGNSEFMDSALGKATEKTMRQIIADVQGMTLAPSGRVKQKSAQAASTAANTAAMTDAIKHTPGKVLAVASKDVIIVSVGSNQGFKDGDKLNLYQTNDVKDAGGNVVFSDDKLVGEVTLSGVKEDRSRASYSGELTVQQGWTVRAK